MSHPSVTQSFHENRPSLVAPVRIDRTGLAGPTPAQARGPHWRRTSHGLYVPSSVTDDDPQQRIVEAAAVLRAGSGAVTGWAALAWLGGRWFDGTTSEPGGRRPVQLALWGWVREQPGIAVCEEGIDPRDVAVVDGLSVTVPVRSICFLMRYAPDDRAAVEVADMAYFNDLASQDELGAYIAAHPAWTGIPRARTAHAYSNENSWSPAEVRARLVWVVDAGLPPPRMNAPVFDLQGRHVGTPDLFDEEAGLVGQYDGALHLAGAQRRADRDRDEAYRGVGLDTFVILAGDMSDRARLAGRMVEARARARWTPPGQRRWTLQPPYWWTPTETVAQRRALDVDQRAKLLRHRAA